MVWSGIWCMCYDLIPWLDRTKWKEQVQFFPSLHSVNVEDCQSVLDERWLWAVRLRPSLFPERPPTRHRIGQNKPKGLLAAMTSRVMQGSQGRVEPQQRTWWGSFVLCRPIPEKNLPMGTGSWNLMLCMSPNMLVLSTCEVIFIFSFLLGQMNVYSQLESIDGTVRVWLVNPHFPPRKADTSMPSCFSFLLTSSGWGS